MPLTDVWFTVDVYKRQELDEVTITSKVKDKVIPEPTDIEIKGNYFHLKTRVPVFTISSRYSSLGAASLEKDEAVSVSYTHLLSVTVTV